jgi:hypothetical protein
MRHHEPGLSVVMSRTAPHRHSRHRHVGRRPNIRTLVMQFERWAASRMLVGISGVISGKLKVLTAITLFH